MIEKSKLFALLSKADLGSIKEVESIDTGLINKTVKLISSKGVYAIQQINDSIFKSPWQIGENEILLYSYCPEFLVQLVCPEKTSMWELEGQYFRITLWEMELISHKVLTTSEMAVSSAELLGKFHARLNQAKSTLFHEIIPGFHDLKRRYSEFSEACMATKVMDNKLDELISGLQSFSFLLEDYSKMIAEEKLLVCHNDLKISNMLFNKNGQAVKIIDLDTLMPGYACTDFGDLVRSACVNCEESELDLDKVKFNFEYLEPMIEAYQVSAQIKSNYLCKGVMFMFYIMSLRFATDYILGNKYYSINFYEENYIRARNQYTLLCQAGQFISNTKL